MTSCTDVLHQCFESVAKCNADITAAVYEKFTSNMPEAQQHIAYLDTRMKGRMLDQIYSLLLAEADKDYLQFEVRMHKGYGADTALYQGLLQAVKQAVRDVLGDTWTAREEIAWDRSIEQIVSDIEKLAATG